MNVPTRLAAFGVGLVAVFAAAVGVGSAVGPVGPVGPAAAASADHAGADAGVETSGHGDGHADETAPSAVAELPGGLMISAEGYTLALADGVRPAGTEVPVAFQVLGPDGEPVTGYDATHDQDLHLIAVRRDLTGYQHVHPTLAPDGTWSTPLDLTPGEWRVFADFAPAGHGDSLTLGADLAVPGSYAPAPLPAPATTAEVDGYTVTLDGELVPGRESELTLSVHRDGRPVTDLEPYLAAYGHLVALRDGDLAYLHVHPGGEPGDGVTAPGPEVTFHATAPSAGDYRLFLDFKHRGVVRTAEFTVHAGAHGHGETR